MLWFALSGVSWGAMPIDASFATASLIKCNEHRMCMLVLGRGCPSFFFWSWNELAICKWYI